MTDPQKEWAHDFIVPTVFSLAVVSLLKFIDPTAPLHTRDDAVILRASPVAKCNMLAASKRMSNFFL
jgi:hypothetical protein